MMRYLRLNISWSPYSRRGRNRKGFRQNGISSQQGLEHKYRIISKVCLETSYSTIDPTSSLSCCTTKSTKLTKRSNDKAEPVWFCLKTQPKREHLAATALRRQFGVECFSPRLRFRRMTQRGPVWFVEAMFPGYLFAKFIYSTQHRAVESSHGISGIVHFGD